MKPRTPLPKKRAKPRSKHVERHRPTAQHRKAARIDEGLREYVRGLPCICESKFGVQSSPTQVAHIQSKGAGGADRNNVVPLCGDCHAAQHRIGIRSFERKYGLDLKAEAQRITREYDVARTNLNLVSDKGVMCLQQSHGPWDGFPATPAWVFDADRDAQRQLVGKFLDWLTTFPIATIVRPAMTGPEFLAGVRDTLAQWPGIVGWSLRKERPQ